MAIEDGLCLGELHPPRGRRLRGGVPAIRNVARSLRTARVTLESRALWEFYHADGIARDVRNQTAAEWDEAHMFQCLGWLYDGFPIPAELARALNPSTFRPLSILLGCCAKSAGGLQQ